MNDTAQLIAAAAAVLSAILYLALRGRRKKNCGGDCGCNPAKKLPPR